MADKSEKYSYAVGRRKTASATVRLYKGKGTSTVNGAKFEEYFPTLADQSYLLEPLAEVGGKSSHYFTAKAIGGGVSGQLGAVRLGIARALVVADEENKPKLKEKSMLTRDDRMVERKKTGQPKARKKPQFSKR